MIYKHTIEFKELKNLKNLSLVNCWLKEIPIELAELELEELVLHFSKFSGNNMKTAIYAILVNENTKIVTEFGGKNISWAQASAKAARKKILA